jgi:5'-3' exonuclease
MYSETNSIILKAPGEAEAFLAMLNRIGHVDYVLTSDSDAFLFGARHVIRK